MVQKYSLLIHNNGSATYHSGTYSSTPDVTLSKGITQYGDIKWSVIHDDLKSPHDGIVIEIGDRLREEKREVFDWRRFDWDMYKDFTTPALKALYEEWMNDSDFDVDLMAAEFSEKLHECVNHVAIKKVVSVHSRPWISAEISDQLKLLRQSKKKYRLRRSPANWKFRKRVTEMITQAEHEWWLSECKRLTQISESEK